MGTPQELLNNRKQSLSLQGQAQQKVTKKEQKNKTVTNYFQRHNVTHARPASILLSGFNILTSFSIIYSGPWVGQSTWMRWDWVKQPIPFPFSMSECLQFEQQKNIKRQHYLWVLRWKGLAKELLFTFKKGLMLWVRCCAFIRERFLSFPCAFLSLFPLLYFTSFLVLWLAAWPRKEIHVWAFVFVPSSVVTSGGKSYGPIHATALLSETLTHKQRFSLSKGSRFSRGS